MTTAMKLLNAAAAAQEALNLIDAAIDAARDLTPDEAHAVVRYASDLHCHAFELQRIALRIPPPKRG
jgi:hypothetical protein